MTVLSISKVTCYGLSIIPLMHFYTCRCFQKKKNIYIYKCSIIVDGNSKDESKKYLIMQCFFLTTVDHKHHANFQMMYSIETANAIIQNLIIKTLDFHFLLLCHSEKASGQYAGVY